MRIEMSEPSGCEDLSNPGDKEIVGDDNRCFDRKALKAFSSFFVPGADILFRTARSFVTFRSVSSNLFDRLN
jgi:hypothetical protein